MQRGLFLSMICLIGLGTLAVGAACLAQTQPTNLAEAKSIAERVVAEHSVKCGEFIAVKWPDYWSKNPTPLLLAKSELLVTEHPLSDAARLNGIEWAGHFSLAAMAQRMCLNTHGNPQVCDRWEEWRDISMTFKGEAKGLEPRIDLQKIRGRWQIGSGDGYYEKPVRVSCNEVPLQ